jgi:hypothetical protein
MTSFDIPSLSPTAWFEFPELGPRARLQVKMSGEENVKYWNALVASSGKKLRGNRAKVSPEFLGRLRDDDRRLFPQYVIVGWEGLLKPGQRHLPEEEQQEVEFSRENCFTLCKELPNHLFDALRTFCNDPANFYEEDDLPPDAEEVAKN